MKKVMADDLDPRVEIIDHVTCDLYDERDVIDVTKTLEEKST